MYQITSKNCYWQIFLLAGEIQLCTDLWWRNRAVYRFNSNEINHCISKEPHVSVQRKLHKYFEITSDYSRLNHLQFQQQLYTNGESWRKNSVCKFSRRVCLNFYYLSPLKEIKIGTLLVLVKIIRRIIFLQFDNAGR